jgi:predicted transcriptional regulator
MELLMSTTITSQIPDDLAALLTRVSGAEERSKPYYVRKGLELILAQWAEDLQDHAGAVKAYDDHFATGPETIS